MIYNTGVLCFQHPPGGHNQKPTRRRQFDRNLEYYTFVLNYFFVSCTVCYCVFIVQFKVVVLVIVVT